MRKLALEELNRASYDQYHQKQKLPIVVVLDNIRSMYNVGSVFRTCDAFLIEKLYLCGITAQPPHREIQKTAIGATESVEWEYNKSMKACIEQLKAAGYQIIGIEQTDESVDITKVTIKTDQKYALLFGNEVDGISDEIIHDLDMALEIPQFGTKHSLNISVSSGIAIWKYVEAFVGRS